MNKSKTIERTPGIAVPRAVNDNPSLRAALGYAQLLSWAVFPLHSIVNGQCTCNNSHCAAGKHPRTKDGLKSATTDASIITEWFTRYPNSNIGIATGSASGFFVLDVDGEEGNDSLERLTDHFGTLPDTVQAITGSGGSHYLFKYREGIGNKTNLFPSIDIRGTGGYIVASPSTHASGNKYEWELSSHPLELDIKEAPSWLLDAIVKPIESSRQPMSSSHWESLMSGVNDGGRNQAATQLAGHLFRRYVDPHIIKNIMELWNERNNPPLDPAELNTIINSIAGKEYRRREEKANGQY